MDIMSLSGSAVLTHGYAGQLPEDSTSIEAHANLCMLCMAYVFFYA